MKYTGGFEGLPALEAAASNAKAPAVLLSPAQLTVNFKAKKDADRKKLEGALGSVTGVRASKVVSAFNTLQANLTVDFRSFKHESLAQTAGDAGYEADCVETEWVSLKVSGGDASKLAKELAALKGVLRVDASGEDVGFWARKVTDDAVKKLAEKLEVGVDKITRS